MLQTELANYYWIIGFRLVFPSWSPIASCPPSTELLELPERDRRMKRIKIETITVDSDSESESFLPLGGSLGGDPASTQLASAKTPTAESSVPALDSHSAFSPSQLAFKSDLIVICENNLSPHPSAMYPPIKSYNCQSTKPPTTVNFWYKPVPIDFRRGLDPRKIDKPLFVTMAQRVFYYQINQNRSDNQALNKPLMDSISGNLQVTFLNDTFRSPRAESQNKSREGAVAAHIPDSSIKNRIIVQVANDKFHQAASSRKSDQVVDKRADSTETEILKPSVAKESLAVVERAEGGRPQRILDPIKSKHSTADNPYGLKLTYKGSLKYGHGKVFLKNGTNVGFLPKWNLTKRKKVITYSVKQKPIYYPVGPCLDLLNPCLTCPSCRTLGHRVSQCPFRSKLPRQETFSSIRKDEHRPGGRPSEATSFMDLQSQ